jgi:hypothetical protein
MIEKSSYYVGGKESSFENIAADYCLEASPISLDQIIVQNLDESFLDESMEKFRTRLDNYLETFDRIHRRAARIKSLSEALEGLKIIQKIMENSGVFQAEMASNRLDFPLSKHPLVQAIAPMIETIYSLVSSEAYDAELTTIVEKITVIGGKDISSVIGIDISALKLAVVIPVLQTKLPLAGEFISIEDLDQFRLDEIEKIRREILDFKEMDQVNIGFFDSTTTNQNIKDLEDSLRETLSGIKLALIFPKK